MILGQTKSLEKFKDFLLLEKGMNQTSTKAYIRHIEYLYEEAGADILKKCKSYSHVSALICSLKKNRKGKKQGGWKQNMAVKTAYMATVFFTWAAREGFIKNNPMQFGHEFKKEPSPPPRYIENYKQTLETLEKHPLHTKRDGCIYRILWASGVRAAELCNIDIDHLDLETGFIKIVEGKGGQFRIAYTNDEAISHLREYVSGLKMIGYIGKPLFFTERMERIKRDTLTKWLIKRSRQMGIYVTPHMFRHGLGRNMRKNGAPLEDIADVLGHKSLTSTRMYTTLPSNEIKKKYNEYHTLSA